MAGTSAPSQTIDEALLEGERLRKLIRKQTATQVRSVEERSTAKATALAWFNNHGPALATLSHLDAYEEASQIYREVLEASDRACKRSTYVALLKRLRPLLISLRSESLVTPKPTVPSSDDPPSFAPLASDRQMQEVLQARWKECVACLEAQAPLSATVMMGGLLETLLLARINRENDKAPVFQAKAAPRDRGKTKQLAEWTLKNYIDVAHELGWVSVSAKDVGEVLRDYRNYIHPHKQLSHGIDLSVSDSELLWEVSKAITRQLLKSAQR
jgi:hypothetical protein